MPMTRRNLHSFKYWGLLWGATVVGHLPSHAIRNSYYRRGLGVVLPKTSVIYWGSRFFGLKGLVIGENSILGDHGFFDGRRGITIGNNVNIASEVRIWTSEHDIESPTFETTGAGVTIGDHAFIGSRVTILPGVRIGEGAVIGAGAVVTHDIPEWTVAFGVPAKPVRVRSRVSYKLSTEERAWFQ
jgi:acetyltransferase-like isoleucine patch superfamily enzyme